MSNIYLKVTYTNKKCKLSYNTVIFIISCQSTQKTIVFGTMTQRSNGNGVGAGRKGDNSLAKQNALA